MLNCQKELFSLSDDHVYLNCAYMSPQLKSVEAVGIEALKKKSRPYNISKDDFFNPVDQLKKAFAKLIHLGESDRIAIIPSASYGIATVAKNVRFSPGHKIIVLEEQFPSNYYSWERLSQEQALDIQIIQAPMGSKRSVNWNARILDAIDNQTAMVAIGNVHWADGTLIDLLSIRAKTDKFGAKLIIDGTQSVGALPIDISELKPDALIVAGYKWLLGPYSIGLAYYNEGFDHGIPIEENWINRLYSEDFRALVNYQSQYQPFAGRYSVGEQSNFILIPMLLKAIEQLLNWGIENIQNYCKLISTPALMELKELGVLIENDAQRCGHLFGLRLNRSLNLELLKEAIVESNIHVSFRGDSIRVSPNVYNTKSDFDKLVACFKEAQM